LPVPPGRVTTRVAGMFVTRDAQPEALVLQPQTAKTWAESLPDPHGR
jgi:hypothetical protein